MFDPVEKRSWKVFYAVRPQRRVKKCRFGRLRDSKGALPLRQVFLLLTMLTASLPNISEAQPPQRYEFSIPAQPVDNALNQLAVQVEASLIFPYDQVRSVESKPVFGFYTVEECLALLLKGTGLSSDHTDGGVIAITSKNALDNDGEKEMAFKRNVLAALIAAIVAPNGMAQDGDRGPMLEEVVVTAQKREQSLQEVPISIYAINADNIEKLRLGEMRDLSVAVPGLTLAVKGAGAFQSGVFMRGVGNTRGESAMTGIYVDNTNLTTYGGFPDLQLFDLERVEVLRGPQGTLYGAGSMGGTLRFITKDPDLTEFDGGMDFSFAGTKGGDPTTRVRGLANVPVVDGKFGLRMTAVYEDQGGWLDMPGVASDVNDDELYNFRIKALWQPADNFSVRGSATVHRSDSGMTDEGEVELNVVSGVFSGEKVAEFKQDYELFDLTLDWDLGWASIVSTTGYYEATYSLRDYGYRLPLNGPRSETAPFDVLLGPDKFQSNTFSSLSQEIRLSSPADSTNLHWTAGIFYSDDEFKETDKAFYFAVPDPINPVEPDRAISRVAATSTSESWAIFGELSYQWEKLELGVGLRQFEDKRIDGADDVELKFTRTSPRVFARYDLTDNSSIYASAAEGFRSGGYTGLFERAEYKPETLMSYELGIKSSFLDGRLTSEFAIFYSEYDGIQTLSAQLLGETVSQFIVNSGDAEIEGFDVNIAYYPSNSFGIGFAAEYNNGEYVYVDPDLVRSTHAVGDPLDEIPDYNFSAWAQYDFELVNSPAFARINYHQQGKSTIRQRSLGDWWVSESGTVNMLNVVLGAERKGFSYELFCDNCLDDRDYFSADVTQQHALRSRPRTVGIQVGYNLN